MPCPPAAVTAAAASWMVPCSGVSPMRDVPSVVLRPVTSEDAMTADWGRLPYDVMEKISTRITNEVREVNRVVLDITSKPPGTIEWE